METGTERSRSVGRDNAMRCDVNGPFASMSCAAAALKYGMTVSSTLPICSAAWRALLSMICFMVGTDERLKEKPVGATSIQLRWTAAGKHTDRQTGRQREREREPARA